jgi:peroxiredoxin
MKLILLFFFISTAFAEVNVGQTAPDFSLPGHDGKEHKLSDYKGSKFIVLEWYNDGCPFVRKHYDSKNMQKLQAEFTKKNVTWLSITSSAEGKQGHLTPRSAKSKVSEEGMKATALLLDPTGKVGRLYGAKTTPHMFVLNSERKVLYAGAIDSVPSTSASDIPQSTNFVKEALDLALAGKKVARSSVRPYGCSVKY